MAARAKKAQRVIVLDMRGVSDFCDYFVIMTASSLRHVNALAETIVEEQRKSGIKPLAGLIPDDESGWIVLDYSSVVAHIFHKPMREFYDLERLWSDARRVRIPRVKAAVMQ